MNKLTCFKAYDIRGKLGDELNEDIAYRIGQAVATQLNPNRIAVGRDIRQSSAGLKAALANGLMDSGVDVIDLGLCGTEEIYFATFQLDVDGGIEITASHNPIDYNGMKFVKRGGEPIRGDSELRSIRERVENHDVALVTRRGCLQQYNITDEYVDHLLGYINWQNLNPLCLVVNAGNGVAGHVVDAIEKRFAEQGVPITFIKINNEPDGTFPKGVPNPLLQENRFETSTVVRDNAADMGIAWDGDFDRCFFYDAEGNFIEGYYIVGLLAEAFLRKYSGEKIIHDPRLTWNTIDIATKYSGMPIQSKTGHVFIKEQMRQENAIYGGEMSSHHYFREFGYCDSGMIPWLLIAEMLSNDRRPLADYVRSCMQKYPCSGEINFKVDDVSKVILAIKTKYMVGSPICQYIDGMSLEFPAWRFNIRASNTEPLLRLNVESRGDISLVKQKVEEITALIKSVSCR